MSTPESGAIGDRSRNVRNYTCTIAYGMAVSDRKYEFKYYRERGPCHLSQLSGCTRMSPLSITICKAQFCK